MVVDATQILHLNLATEFLLALTNERFVKRLTRIDGPSREAPPAIPISGQQEQDTSRLIGNHRMRAQSVPVVKSHVQPNSGLTGQVKLSSRGCGARAFSGTHSGGTQSALPSEPRLGDGRSYVRSRDSCRG